MEAFLLRVRWVRCCWGLGLQSSPLLAVKLSLHTVPGCLHPAPWVWRTKGVEGTRKQPSQMGGVYAVVEISMISHFA